MAERKRPTITETVADLDGQKVLIVKADDQIVAVQTAAVVAGRLDNLAAIVEALDTALAMSDAEHLAEATKRIDERIANLESRKAALTVDGVAATAKARLQERRLALFAQRDGLAAAAAEMSAEAPAPRE